MFLTTAEFAKMSNCVKQHRRPLLKAVGILFFALSILVMYVRVYFFPAVAVFIFLFFLKLGINTHHIFIPLKKYFVHVSLRVLLSTSSCYSSFLICVFCLEKSTDVSSRIKEKLKIWKELTNSTNRFSGGSGWKTHVSLWKVKKMGLGGWVGVQSKFLGTIKT